MDMQLSTLRVNDEVAVVRHGSWNTITQGVYVVAKVDKVKVVLKRKSDGYERIFSVKTGLEKGSSRYHSASIESVERMEARMKAQDKERRIRDAWKTLEAAASQKNFPAAEAALAEIALLNTGE